MHATTVPFRVAPSTAHRIPTELSERLPLADGRSVLIRPVVPQDAERHQAFVRALSPLSRRRRFHGPVAELPAPLLRYMTEVDYTTHLALLAESGAGVQVAEARWVRREDEPGIADFALAVADDWQRSGLGTALLRRLESSARERGVRRLCGDVLASNEPMAACMRRAGWRLQPDRIDASLLAVHVDLTPGVDAGWRAAA